VDSEVDGSRTGGARNAEEKEGTEVEEDALVVVTVAPDVKPGTTDDGREP